MEFIHIGKCGGGTIGYELEKNNIHRRCTHMRPPIFNEDEKYLIVVRNPIKRAISAFNWRYKKVVKRGAQMGRFDGEYETLVKHQTLDKMAQSTDLNDKYIHHIPENISFYLSKFLELCKKKNIVGVISQETLNEDMNRIFNIKVTSVLHKNNKDTPLSTESYSILKEHLKKDYECIDKLFKMSLIKPETYELLSI